MVEVDVKLAIAPGKQAAGDRVYSRKTLEAAYGDVVKKAGIRLMVGWSGPIKNFTEITHYVVGIRGISEITIQTTDDVWGIALAKYLEKYGKEDLVAFPAGNGVEEASKEFPQLKEVTSFNIETFDLELLSYTEGKSVVRLHHQLEKILDEIGSDILSRAILGQTIYEHFPVDGGWVCVVTNTKTKYMSSFFLADKRHKKPPKYSS